MEEMKITVIRTDYSPESTTGVMLVDGNYFCVTLEDTFREGHKVPGKTCIPAGRYPVELSLSNRFQKIMPLLIGVPGFDGVRIHGGNTSADTLGCILAAAKRIDKDRVMTSQAGVLTALLQSAKGPHEIQIINAWRA